MHFLPRYFKIITICVSVVIMHDLTNVSIYLKMSWLGRPSDPTDTCGSVSCYIVAVLSEGQGAALHSNVWLPVYPKAVKMVVLCNVCACH